jgi:hypothetical protein
VSTPIPGADANHERWRTVMIAGPDCVPLERLVAAALAEPDAVHVASCARCQTERALAQSFEAAEAAPDEGAAVAWIVSETRRRVFPDVATVQPAASPARWFALPRWATWAGAALAASLGVYLLIGPRGAAPPAIDTTPVYRSAAVAVVAPVGEVADVPTELRWQTLAGAVRYTVRVSEVDGAELWQTTTPETTVVLPDDVRAAAKPARTLTWRVEAFDTTGAPVGEAATASFRVRP